MLFHVSVCPLVVTVMQVYCIKWWYEDVYTREYDSIFWSFGIGNLYSITIAIKHWCVGN